MSKQFILYEYKKQTAQEISDKAAKLRTLMSKRRSVRHFSEKEVHKDVITDLIMAAASAPSGANKQPWTFCAISDPSIKKQIREAAEKEEYINYNGRMSEEWLGDLHPLGTDWQKEFLELAPWLIVIFKKSYDIHDHSQKKNYYVSESVGIAAGFFISCVHQAGLATLTHTPSPMNFLTKILGRPENEKPFLLLPVGYPEEGALVPDIARKKEEEVISWYIGK